VYLLVPYWDAKIKLIQTIGWCVLNASNISKEGFLIAGIFTSQQETNNHAQQSSAVLGGLKFVNWNGDTRINNGDKPENRLVPLQPSQDVYIAAADFTPSYQ